MSAARNDPGGVSKDARDAAGVNGGDSGVNGGASGVNGGDSGVNGGNSAVNGRGSAVNGGGSAVNGGGSGVNGSRVNPPSQDGSLGVWDASRDMSMYASHGALSALQEEDEASSDSYTAGGGSAPHTEGGEGLGDAMTVAMAAAPALVDKAQVTPKTRVNPIIYIYIDKAQVKKKINCVPAGLSLYAHTCTYMYMYMYIYMNVYIDIDIYICIYICVYIYIYICISIRHR